MQSIVLSAQRRRNKRSFSHLGIMGVNVMHIINTVIESWKKISYSITVTRSKILSLAVVRRHPSQALLLFCIPTQHASGFRKNPSRVSSVSW